MLSGRYYLFVPKTPERLLPVAHEYVSFIALIGSLFVITGGIHITVKAEFRRLSKCPFSFTGAVAANIIGTNELRCS